jgi:hypothetical protein
MQPLNQPLKERAVQSKKGTRWGDIRYICGNWVLILGQLNGRKQMEDLEVIGKNNIRADLEEIWCVNWL